MKSSGIGGQAVIEGVMMKNGGKYAVAVRKPDGTIHVEQKTCTDASKRNIILRLPIIRGVLAFVDSLVLGMSTLTYSASFYEEEEESAFEKRLNKATKGHGEQVMNGFTVFLSVILAVVIFMGIPFLFKEFVGSRLPEEPLYKKYIVPICEGLIRLLIFILYILLISKMEDIKRMFMYHGAEHKAINCIENGRNLTVDNVRRSSKEHKRCGTSFMLNVLILSIIVFIFIPEFDVKVFQFLVRIALLPVIAGISYEFSRFSGRHQNAFVNVLSKPGLLMQALTTREPDDGMIEVAIESVKAVFDWESFVADMKKEKIADRSKQGKAGKEEKSNNSSKNDETDSEEKISETVPITEEVFKPLEVDISQLFDIKLPETSGKKVSKQKKREAEKESINTVTEEKEEDSILAALDFMFEYSGEKTIIELSDENNEQADEEVDSTPKKRRKKQA